MAFGREGQRDGECEAHGCGVEPGDAELGGGMRCEVLFEPRLC
jgi:hypothetical protein